MKPFESFMADYLEEFLAYRKALGLKNRSVRSYLRCFDQHLIKTNSHWNDFNAPFFLDYQRRIPGEGRSVNSFFQAVDKFFQFLIRQEILDENPLQDIPPRPANRYVPFIFAPIEVEQLLKTIQTNIRKTKTGFFRDYTIYTAISLIARCGLRISEPLSLQLSSYRAHEKTIYIEKTKFYKDRVIPVPITMAKEFETYLCTRERCIKEENLFLFPGTLPEKGLGASSLYPVFKRAVETIGLNQSKKILGTTTFGAPRVHSLRHSFAVTTLNNIKNRGADPQKGLPVLAAYMGHRMYSYTAQYLKMLDANQRNNLVDFTLRNQEKL